MNKKLIKEVKTSFKQTFKTKPLMVFSPGRINLIGEHTDYNDGFVFPAAINKGIALAIQKTKKEVSTVYALNKEETYQFGLQNVAPLQNGGWRNYILGVVSEIQKRGIELQNFNIVFAGNIPGGAGLSSSAALENSVVYGLNKLFKLGISKEEMILISQQAEHNYAGVKCGIMDQYASMFGVKNSALLLDCRTVKSKLFKLNFKDYKLLLINTNVKHDLSESAYNDRREVCEKVSKKLNIKALRDATIQDLNTIKADITEEDYQKALYIIEENQRVTSFSKAIKADDIQELGALLYQSHNGLSTQFKVSCKELDFLVDKTKNNPNILGSRMMGGGFGGCTINLILKSEVKSFKKEIAKAFKKEFGNKCSIYNVKLSNGTQKIK
ncbi:galactokinase [Cellulophaga lytica]|nr:galactokinase [Cellulophaga lytica]